MLISEIRNLREIFLSHPDSFLVNKIESTSLFILRLYFFDTTVVN